MIKTKGKRGEKNKFKNRGKSRMEKRNKQLFKQHLNLNKVKDNIDKCRFNNKSKSLCLLWRYNNSKSNNLNNLSKMNKLNKTVKRNKNIRKRNNQPHQFKLHQYFLHNHPNNRILTINKNNNQNQIQLKYHK